MSVPIVLWLGIRDSSAFLTHVAVTSYRREELKVPSPELQECATAGQRVLRSPAALPFHSKRGVDKTESIGSRRCR